MSEIIKRRDNQNEAIVSGGEGIIPLTHFNLIKLNINEKFEYQMEGYELMFVILSGSCNVDIDGFSTKLSRKDIWTEKADSVYVPIGAKVEILCTNDNTEIAIGGMQCDVKYEPFRVAPDAVKVVEVGSSEGKTYRQVHYILDKKIKGKTGNLIINELFAEEGCWSAYPPHKHDTENPPVETAFEELYHYRFNPESGFGGQFVFLDNGESECYMVKSGDTVLIDKGYHPTVYAPGQTGYMFVILSGKCNDSLIQHFKEEYAYLAKGVNGVQDMLDSYQKK